LDIGEAYLTFDGNGTPTWGKITLTGRITSAYYTGVSQGVIFLLNGVSIESTADIANTAHQGTAISNYSTGTVTISGGKVSTTTGKAIDNPGKGSINISGGKV
jgi:hypothetical protein